ncbi:MAG: transcription-repair coupling factor [Pseudonocardiales bacterium]|nr:MAG: transcription-repair coupling factor [Pseudonocardiales bacterium]
MSLRGLLDVVLTEPTLRQVIGAAGTGTLEVTAPGGLQPFAIAAVAAEPGRGGAGRPVCAVTATSREAEELAAALGDLLDHHQVAVFPSWETLPHERLSPRPDTVGRRLAVLRRLAHPDPDEPEFGPLRVVVAPVRSLLQPIVAGLGELTPVAVREGDEVDLDRLVANLVDIGYARADLVETRGELAVRGGILDVFPPTEQHPVRLDFFGDEVDEVRYFAVADQRSSGPAEHGLWAPPCRELLLTAEVRARAKELAAERFADPSAERGELAGMLERIADGIAVEGMEALAPVLVDGLRPMLADLPAGVHVVVCDPERVRTRAAELVRTSEEFLAASWSASAGGGAAPIDLGAVAYRQIDDLRATAGELGIPWWGIGPLRTDDELVGTALVIDAQAAEAYRGDTARAVADVRELRARGLAVTMIFAGPGPARRAVEVLSDADVAARLSDDVAMPPTTDAVTVTTGRLGAGFRSEPLRLAVFTESELTGQRGSLTPGRQRMPSRRRNAVDLVQLMPGDYVVHEHHGVGRYVEMVRRTVAGGDREYLILEYAASRRGQPSDRLFVPTDSLDLITRYIGGEQPTLSRLGGSDWARTKGRARKAVREIAADLIRLYSVRMASPGYAFGPDTPWQRELEDAFPYVETPDQAAAIDEVKADMQRAVPMDRVICGDVGYGKTEIAVRAAFKAVQDGKQVAVLVPTTLLAQQHLVTFSERFAQFPIKVSVVSRFNSAAEQSAVLDGVAAGSVDVVIGTHRLLQPSIRFKDLGLIVVDEEQRFGVEHKEYLKSMRTAVDVLSMSATPIPRTLEMSLTGIREMSTILTPPEERHPVLTFVGQHDQMQVGAAIRRELLRDGQVFFVHNRVESIDRAARRLHDLVPEARIAVAHGQMNEDRLEKVMVGFWEREYDVLVCTTIVEAGLDIANANTLIVERADSLGLSQLHQLRGRIGRSRERAYAYFLYPPEKPLTETAYDRLATIAQHTDLGAGMAVAMKDLEIRGAGNLLGGEQSGHIAGVGFDLYVRLVGEAISDFRRSAEASDFRRSAEGSDFRRSTGDAPSAEPEPVEVKVDLPVDAHLPHDYIPGERLRMEAYRKLAGAVTDSDIDAVAAELTDRYGEPSLPVQALLAIARLRALARLHRVGEISVQGRVVRFAGVTLADSAQLRLTRLYPGASYRATVSALSVPRPLQDGAGSAPVRDIALIQWCATVLTDVLGAPAPAGRPA